MVGLGGGAEGRGAGSSGACRRFECWQGREVGVWFDGRPGRAQDVFGVNERCAASGCCRWGRAAHAGAAEVPDEAGEG